LLLKLVYLGFVPCTMTGQTKRLATKCLILMVNLHSICTVMTCL
jgi:hypothetical protein